MNLKFLILIFIALPCFVEAQKVVLKNDEKTREEYYVLKEDRITKHGRYKQFHYNGRQFIDGNYKGGLKDSVWSFYDRDGVLCQKYDYSKKLLLYYENKNDKLIYSIIDEDVACDSLERPPLYIGGLLMFARFIQSTLVYPKSAERKGIEGKVVVSFIVDKYGKVKGQKVVKGVEASLDEAAIKVIQLFPDSWISGVCNKGKVDVEITVTITFKLPE